MLTTAVDNAASFPPLGESELLAELVSHLQWTGLDDPTMQVYSPANQSPELLDLLLTLLVIYNLSRMVAMASTGFLVGKKLSDVDGWIFLSGLVTLLHQQHPQVGSLVLAIVMITPVLPRSVPTLWPGFTRQETHSLSVVRVVSWQPSPPFSDSSPRLSI